MKYLEEVRNVLADTLNISDLRSSLQADSALLGSIAELDSMAVVSLIAALENYFGLTVDDDEISSATFATLGSLTRFVDQKLAA